MKLKNVRLIVSALLLTFISMSKAQNLALKPPSLVNTRVLLSDLRFVGLDGSQHRLSEFKGKVVVLNIWGTWCAQCVFEMPTLDGLYERLRQDHGVAILLVSLNNSADEITAFRKKYPSHCPLFLLYNDDLPGRFQLHSFPETFLIGKDGRLRAEHAGPANWSSASVLLFIKHLEEVP